MEPIFYNGDLVVCEQAKRSCVEILKCQHSKPHEWYIGCKGRCCDGGYAQAYHKYIDYDCGKCSYKGDNGCGGVSKTVLKKFPSKSGCKIFYEIFVNHVHVEG